MRGLRWCALALAVLAAAPASATVFEPREFADTEQKLRYRTLVEELRCLVCQNQNLADSNADLAADLRRQVYVMLTKGASDKEIVDYMVARYGDFVLYRPPMKPTTVALWFGPAMLAVAGLVVLFWHVRRRANPEPAAALSEQERSRLKAALGRDGSPP